jgi:1-acyl-sn-glycerol-3-phosphate acyltransferase
LIFQRIWYSLLQITAAGLYVGLLGGRAYHRERVPRRGGVLVVSNHQSYLDPILAAIPIYRPFNPMARATLFRVGAFSWLIRSVYAFPVKLGRADVGAMKEALRRLRAGRIVLVFPEGTRTRDGSIGQLQAGIILMAQRAGVPVLPMVIEGAYECWPRGRLLPTFGPVRVIYGEPVGAEQVREAPAEETIEEVRRRMIELQAEVRKIEEECILRV